VRPERLHHVPCAEIEPRAQIPKTARLKPVEIADRPFEPDRRRVHGADRGKALVAALMGDDCALARFLVEQRHVHGADFRPQADQGKAPGGEIARHATPRGFIQENPRPRHVRGGLVQVRDLVDQTHVAIPESLS
jgi:hypothetical protein